ncbi:DNA mismatch repair protein MutS [Solitalea longa]|uniref:DNA mismatch repair protein MutS n=1 Tax=Solitalea longa TaxID=2079460 RepID=A0A2S5A757_9SPHI|nr:DUF2027 domain-containing protein [Solitalea longa]POY38430.1 DNA mismatch repair protein MutS [Solitalea longa]
MNYKLGDFVRFVDERREGYITRIINHQTVGVTGEDDFEIPVLISKITLVHGSHLDDDEPEEKQSLMPASTSNFVKHGIYWGVVSDAKAKSVVHLYLINETSFQLLVSVIGETKQQFKSIFAGTIEPHSNQKITSYSLSELDAWPKLIIQTLRHSFSDFKPEQALVGEFKFKAKDFSSSKKSISALNDTGWLFQIDEPELIINIDELKESFFNVKVETPKVAVPPKEIDLHIEQLRDDHQFINKSDILKIQLDKFHQCLEAAIVHHFSSIVFIHGIGNGILKHELYKVLSKHPHVKTFKDAGKDKFGYGATEVILK